MLLCALSLKFSYGYPYFTDKKTKTQQKLVTGLPEVAQLVRQLDHESRGSDSTPQAAPDEDIPRVNLAVRKRVFLLTCSQEAEPEGTGSLLLQSVARLVP